MVRGDGQGGAGAGPVRPGLKAENRTVTDSPRTAPLAFDSIEDVLAFIRSDGQRVSTACRVVLEALFEAEGPVSAQFIAGGLDGRTVELEVASVYRNLERLEELGVVQHVHLGHGPGLYLLVGSGPKEFLVCERCDRVTSVEPDELESVREQIRESFGYEAHFGHFPVIGLCPACAREETGRGPTPDRGTAAGSGQRHEHSHGDFVHSHPTDQSHGTGRAHRH